ncbi:MAG: hypothetical protein KDD68_20615, partial [Bdellovibrionales bacterium]|nr:hypothetical protein [Bdellovibrionales bacterium]
GGGSCQNWDFSANKACSPGTYNCDCSGHCGSTVACSGGGGGGTAPPPPSGNCRTITNTGSRVEGAGGFLWKPISEGDRKLAVLFPSSSRTTRATLTHSSGLNESGRYVGRTNGDRPTFRFSRPGGQYPGGTKVCE